MKTFRMIGMALVAVLISMTLVSCDDDDDDDYNDGPDPIPGFNDPANIADTYWLITSDNEGDFNYGSGDYVYFYSTGDGKFDSPSQNIYSAFTYEEESSKTITLTFDDGTVMCGVWNYTDDEEEYVDFEYYWVGEEVDYTMKLVFQDNL